MIELKSKNPKRTIEVDSIQPEKDIPATRYVISEGENHVSILFPNPIVEEEPSRCVASLERSLDDFIALRS